MEIGGEGITNLPVGKSSDYLCSSSVSGIGESHSMEIAISSAARASGLAVLIGSSLEGLGAMEVLPPDPPDPRSTLLQKCQG